MPNLTPEQEITGTSPVTVVFKTGRKERHQFRQLELVEIYKYIDAIALDETPRIVALCLGQPVDWINQLTPESYAELAKLVHAQNFTTAMVIVGSDPVAAARFGKVLAQLQTSAQALLSSSQDFIARAGALGICGGDIDRILHLTLARLDRLMEESTREQARLQLRTLDAVQAGMSGGDAAKELREAIQEEIGDQG